MNLSVALDPSSLKLISKINQSNQELLICENPNGKYILRSMNHEEIQLFKAYQHKMKPFANHFEYLSANNGSHFIRILRLLNSQKSSPTLQIHFCPFPDASKLSTAFSNKIRSLIWYFLTILRTWAKFWATIRTITFRLRRKFCWKSWKIVTSV